MSTRSVLTLNGKARRTPRVRPARIYPVIPRRQFKLWLILQLQRLGMDVPLNATYAQLRDALERLPPFTPAER